MHFDKSEVIAGERLLRIRGILRYFHDWDSSISVERIERRLECTRSRARKLLKALVARGFIEPSTDEWARPGDYEISDLGGRLVGWRAIPRINREKADRLIAELLERVREINGRDELAYKITYVGVFGSYVDGKNDLGDIDIAYEMEWRDPSRKPVEYNRERFEASGRASGSFFLELYYGAHEVKKILKARNRYISLHTMDEMKRLGIRPRQLFPKRRKGGKRDERVQETA